MTCGLSPVSRKAPPHVDLRRPVAALVAGALLRRQRRRRQQRPPVATVHDVEISESDVEALASDAGFLSFIGAPEPDDGEDDVSQTEAGRRTLTWLIGRALIDSELAVQDLAVEDEALDQAADDLGPATCPRRWT